MEGGEQYRTNPSYRKSATDTEHTDNLLKQDAESITQMRESLKKNKNDHIRMCHFIAMMLTVYLGGFQFGIIISMWNVAWKPFAWLNGITDDIEGDANKDSYIKNVTVQSLTTVGCAMGALFAGVVMKYGRWKCLMLANVLTIASCFI